MNFTGSFSQVEAAERERREEKRERPSTLNPEPSLPQPPPPDPDTINPRTLRAYRCDFGFPTPYTPNLENLQVRFWVSWVSSAKQRPRNERGKRRNESIPQHQTLRRKPQPTRPLIVNLNPQTTKPLTVDLKPQNMSQKSLPRELSPRRGREVPAARGGTRASRCPSQSSPPPRDTAKQLGYSSQSKNKYSAEMRSGSKEGSCLWLIDYHISQL